MCGFQYVFFGFHFLFDGFILFWFQLGVFGVQLGFVLGFVFSTGGAWHKNNCSWINRCGLKRLMFKHDKCATYLAYPHIFKCDFHDIAQPQLAMACTWRVHRAPYPSSGTAKHLDRKKQPLGQRWLYQAWAFWSCCIQNALDCRTRSECHST